jgi:hypothetical protein
VKILQKKATTEQQSLRRHAPRVGKFAAFSSPPGQRRVINAGMEDISASYPIEDSEPPKDEWDVDAFMEAISVDPDLHAVLTEALSAQRANHKRGGGSPGD